MDLAPEHYFAAPAACYKSGGDPTYAAYDDTRWEATLLSGLSGAGKDHYLRHTLPDLPVVSLDALRDTLSVALGDAQGAVIDAAREQAHFRGRNGGIGAR